MPTCIFRQLHCVLEPRRCGFHGHFGLGAIGVLAQKLNLLFEVCFSFLKLDSLFAPPRTAARKKSRPL